MTRGDLNRALASCESWTERYLIWKAGLPTPWTFVVCAVELGVAFVAGLLL